MNSFGSGLASGMSSATSDPSTAHMRVFVGNLNTPNITKPTLQNVFGKYGAITAISIHRGFAFVQYNSSFAARAAVEGEHGSIIAGQTIDINISSEPKPNQKPATNSAQSFGGYDGLANGGYEAAQAGWPPKRGRGAMRGAARGVIRGARGGLVRGGAMRGARGGGRGRGAPNKVQTGRVEKPYQANKSKLAKKPMLPPLNARSIPVESPVIGDIAGSAKEPSIASNGAVDLPALKRQLLDVRSKIDSLLKVLPNHVPAPEESTAETETPPVAAADDSMELEESTKE